MYGEVKYIDNEKEPKSKTKYEFQCLECKEVFLRLYRDKDRKHRCSIQTKNNKRCFKCKQWKELSEFHKAKYVSGGYGKVCKICRSIYMKVAEEKRKDNKEIMSLRRASKVCAQAKKRAEKKDILFDLDKDFLYNLFLQQSGKCFYSDIKMLRKCKLNIYSPSLDRKDPLKGYTKDNVVWCINGVNSFKQNLTAVDFLKLVHSIKWKQVEDGQ